MVMRSKHQKRCRDEQAENDAFVRMVHGVKRADRIQQIWNNSFPQFGKSREEVFRENAKREGFTDLQVNRFLDLP
jgi:hypothetical protein